MFDYRISKKVGRFIVSIIKMYDKSKDHGRKHIISVLKNAREYINNNLDKLNNHDIDLIYLGCALHDIGFVINPHDRKNHHMNSGVYVENNVYLNQLLSKNDIDVIRYCCIYHRASNNHIFDDLSPHVKIVHDADNTFDILETIERAIYYRVRNNMDKKLMLEDAFEHIIDKHHVDGYNEFILDIPDSLKSKLKIQQEIVSYHPEILRALINNEINKLKEK